MKITSSPKQYNDFFFLVIMREHNYKKLVRECDIDTPPVAGSLEAIRRGFTEQGRGAVIKNIMQYVIDDAEQLKIEVTKAGGDAFIYNALVFRVMTGIQNVLDAVARYCEDQYPSTAPKADDRVYFDRYSFDREEVRTIHYLQQKIAVLTFGGKTFYHMANYLKHEMPWVGRVTISDTAQKVDILDNNDIGLVYDMIVPAVNHTMSCISIVYKDAASFTAKGLKKI